MELMKVNNHAFLDKISQQINDLIKRTVDAVISAIVLLLLAPVFGLVVLAIRRDTPGPAFYRGPRMGRYGKTFHMLKFRTMYERLESYQGPRVTAQDDPRVTRLGHWLRETKLNELPQFWNVLKGEMSLVGPRPETPILRRPGREKSLKRCSPYGRESPARHRSSIAMRKPCFPLGV